MPEGPLCRCARSRPAPDHGALLPGSPRIDPLDEQLQPPAAVPAKAERCDVGGGTGPTGSTCTLADAVIVRRALLSPAAATIQPVCAGAE